MVYLLLCPRILLVGKRRVNLGRATSASLDAQSTVAPDALTILARRCASPLTRLLDLDAGRGDDFLPLLHLVGDLAAEGVGAVRRRIGTELEELLRHVRLLEELDDRAIER